MKTLITVAAAALTMLMATTTATAADRPDAVGRWSVVQPNPQGFGLVQPNPRFWGIIKPNHRGYGGTAGQNAHRLGAPRPFGAVGRW